MILPTDDSLSVHAARSWLFNAPEIKTHAEFK